MNKLSIYLGIIFILFLSTILNATDDDNKYSVKNIPPALLEDAGAVIRNRTIDFEIQNKSDAAEKVTIAVTIFKKDKQDYGQLKVWYDKFRTIENLDGKIYDKNGEEVRDLESRDIKDYSDYADYSLYSDNRVKIAELYYDKFPYTVEYEYEVRYDGYLDYPSWFSRYNSDPVEYTSFNVSVPSDYKLRYWCNRDSVMPAISSEDGHRNYSWEASNLDKLTDEELKDDIEDLAAVVRIAPSEFNMDGFEGNMTSWKNFGLWYYKLSKDKYELPEEALQDINDRIKSLKSKKEIIESLYKYLQSRARYVSVQLGIGGWQPFDAEYVHTNRYGDCKALSNYMVSILKAAGITAYPVLIEHDGKKPLITEFPEDQFNHVIVCVPLESDTTWLECTSRDLPAGSVGWGSENRNALMITPEGGFIVKTPATNCANNIQQRSCLAKLSTGGRAEVDINARWYGDQHDYVLYVTDNLTPRVQEKWLKSFFTVPDINLNNYTFTAGKDSSNEIEMKAGVTLARYASLTGNRIFFNPCLMERRTYVPAKVSMKISPVRYNYPFTDIDSVKYFLPAGYKPEALPKEENIETTFAKFISKTIDNGDGTLQFFRLLKIKDYSISPDKYNEYRDFLEKVVKADRSQVVLIKK